MSSRRSGDHAAGARNEKERIEKMKKRLMAAGGYLLAVALSVAALAAVSEIASDDAFLHTVHES